MSKTYIDIDNIEELKNVTFDSGISFIDERIDKINQLIQAVKQLNKEIKEVKEK